MLLGLLFAFRATWALLRHYLNRTESSCGESLMKKAIYRALMSASIAVPVYAILTYFFTDYGSVTSVVAFGLVFFLLTALVNFLSFRRHNR